MLNAARRGAVRFVNEATRHHRREFRSGAVLLSIVAVYARPLPTQRLSDWGSETSTVGRWRVEIDRSGRKRIADHPSSRLIYRQRSAEMIVYGPSRV